MTLEGIKMPGTQRELIYGFLHALIAKHAGARLHLSPLETLSWVVHSAAQFFGGRR